MKLFWMVWLIVAASSAGGQEWTALPGMTSAKLAAAGWDQKSAAGISWSDDQQGVVSFWELATPDRPRFTMRCVTFFDSSFRQLADSCFQSSSGQ
jgi:hypothetical protein